MKQSAPFWFQCLFWGEFVVFKFFSPLKKRDAMIKGPSVPHTSAGAAAEGDDGSLPSQDDYDAIVQSVKDYAGGWYDGDAKRMRRCLHPDLVKRTIEPDDQEGKLKLRPPNTYDSMVKGTEAGGDSSDVSPAQRRYQIDVLDVFRHVATARCISPLYVDYVHLAKFADKRWLIVNVIWELRTGTLKPAD